MSKTDIKKRHVQDVNTGSMEAPKNQLKAEA